LSTATRTRTRHGIVKVDPDVLIGLAARKSVKRKLAPGFKAHKELNLTPHGGKTIANLAFRSFYVAGASWAESDIQNIDTALSGALADPHLNNVLLQYFPGATAIPVAFQGSAKLPGAAPASFSRDDVNTVLQGLINDGTLAGTNYDTTVICLYLPPGSILTTDAAGGVGKLGDGEDDKASSLEGLGGYHGSCHIGAQRVYFAVGVYSQFINGKPNGIPIWPDSWKNVVATFYHELNEARTDPDVEEAIRTNSDALLGWYSDAQNGGEIGDIPINEAGANLRNVMVEVTLANGQTAPVQLMWSNAVGGPEGPFA
jgi:hypothetical protein